MNTHKLVRKGIGGMILPVSHPQRGKLTSPVLLTSLLISRARQQTAGTQRESGSGLSKARLRRVTNHCPLPRQNNNKTKHVLGSWWATTTRFVLIPLVVFWPRPSAVRFCRVIVLWAAEMFFCRVLLCNTSWSCFHSCCFFDSHF